MGDETRTQIETALHLPHRVVSAEEMAAWPVDPKRSEDKTWSEVAWGGDREDRPKLFNWNIWPNRVVFRVNTPEGTEVVRGKAVWRRSARSIRVKGLKLLHAESGDLIQDTRLVHYDQERVIVDFRPARGNGTYHLYYGAAEPPLFDPSPSWEALAKAAPEPPHATAVAIEARCALDSFYPMEVVALESEVKALLAAHPRATYLVFPEERDRPIKLRTEIPAHWAEEGPAQTLCLEADRNEYRVFQLGLWACRADQHDVQVRTTDLRAPDGIIPAGNIQCLTLESRTHHLFMGRPTGPYDVPQGQVRALWFGIDLPEACAPGVYTGKVIVQPTDQPPTEVTINLEVSDRIVAERGDHDLWRLSRLRWLESDVGLGEKVYAPFTPLTISEYKGAITTWGHSFVLSAAGLIRQVRSGEEAILAAPITLEGTLRD
ncbi:MAG: glycoside hydrolase domain-containing protein, partial [Anaerolineae bacterium]